MRACKWGVLLLMLSALSGFAQQATTTVPSVISYRSKLRDFSDTPNAPRVVGVTFAIYAQQEGGVPLWLENQNVTIDATGHYSVLLGSLSPSGIPSDLFSTQEERWLGVRREGEAEEPRVRLASVPYAFRALEAETLGGLPASAFVRSDLTATSESSPSTPPASTSSQSPTVSRLVGPASGHGTKGYMAMWLNSVYLGNSAFFQDNNQNVGLGTTTPAAKLDVSGNVNSSSGFAIGGTPILTASMTSGNLYSGFNVGGNTTTGSSNTGNGNGALLSNTSGTANVAQGSGALQSNTTGSNNIAVGYHAGANNVTGSSDLYIGNRGPAGGNESNTIRIGDSANQAAAYIAGVSGAPTNSGVPVFIDSTGKLGTGGGAVSFSQVNGTLSSPQFGGTYSNSVILTNSTNVFDGNFIGNGSGLSGVTSGLSWPIVTKSSDYLIQASDFSTPTSYGNFLILTGPVSHTFTLPNPPPPNGNCVAIGNVADAGINSGTNVFLTINANGLNVDSSVTVPTQPRRVAYLYCSDGTGYFRLGYNQNGVSEIGPWLYTLDTGVQDQLKTTFRNGMDFGLSTGSMIFLLPKFPNTSTTPTLDVNGLGAKKILRFRNHPLAPGDLVTTTLALLIYDGNFWELINPQTIAGTVTTVTATAPLVSTGGTTPNISCPTCITTAALSGTTGSIGGSALTAGSCSSGTATVSGAVVGHPVAVSASDGSLPNGLIILSAAVTSANTVTVQLCATASVTPVANTYNVSTQ